MIYFITFAVITFEEEDKGDIEMKGKREGWIERTQECEGERRKRGEICNHCTLQNLY